MIKTGSYVYFEDVVDLMKHITFNQGNLYLFNFPFEENQKPDEYPAIFYLDETDINHVHWIQGKYNDVIIEHLKKEIKKAKRTIRLLKEDLDG